MAKFPRKRRKRPVTPGWVTAAEALAAALRERGIIVRHFRLPRIENHLRITIGTPEQNAALLEALSEILS